GLAGAAAEHAAALLGAVAAGYRQVSGPPFPLVGAPGIQATEAGEVVHGAAPQMRSSRPRLRCVAPMRWTIGLSPSNGVRPPRLIEGTGLMRMGRGALPVA